MGRKQRILFIVAGLLLAMSTLGSTSAAFTYYSDNYTAQMEIYDIGVTLVETSAQGTKDISSRDYTGANDEWKQTGGTLLQDMLKESNGKLVLGKNYTEALSVKNSGNMDEYVRVRIFKSWLKEDDTKETTLAPDLIMLNMTKNGWLVDEAATTEERMVLYWPKILKEGDTTPAFSDTVKIDSSVASKVTKSTVKEGPLTTVTTTFNYDGVRFNLEVEVDAVQTHNAKDAIKSAWGIDVNIAEDGTLSLVR